MYIRKTRLLCGMLCFFMMLTWGCAAKYAVLISTNNITADDIAYYSEWWYDLFLQYKMLREQGFKDENIYVLYGNGIDFNTSYGPYNSAAQFGHAITDMAVSKANVQSVFTTLAPKVRSCDYLYVWWMGHGGGYGPDSCNLSMSISNTGEHVSDVEFVSYINTIANYRKRSVAIMTCHSGGMLNNLNTAGNRTITLTSSTCVQSSYSISGCNGKFHAEFSYTLPNALRKQNPCGTVVNSDYDANGCVSQSEAHQYNAATMTTSTPQMMDPDGIAAATCNSRTKP